MTAAATAGGTAFAPLRCLEGSTACQKQPCVTGSCLRGRSAGTGADILQRTPWKPASSVLDRELYQGVSLADHHTATKSFLLLLALARSGANLCCKNSLGELSLL